MQHINVRVYKKDDLGRAVCNDVQFSNIGVKQFFNVQHLFIKLSPYQRCFFDFLCEEMHDELNWVFIDHNLKTKFITFLEKIGADKTKGKAVNGFVPRLLGLGLLLTTTAKGYYTVNPKYVYKGTAKQRSDVLKQLIQDRLDKGGSLVHLINTTEDKFLDGFKVAVERP